MIHQLNEAHQRVHTITHDRTFNGKPLYYHKDGLVLEYLEEIDRVLTEALNQYLLRVLDIDGEVQNPYWDKTKGEMASNCSNGTLLKKLASDSLSCSSPTKGRWNGLGIEHCGYCLPCIIRRASLEAAFGANNDTTRYTVSDLCSKELNTLKAEGVQIRSFQYAIERVKKQPKLANLLIHKPGSLADEIANLDQLAAVYHRGLMEVSRLISGVRTRPK